MKIVVIICLIVVVVGSIYLMFQDHLPPRTPQKIARLLSQLPINRSANVKIFEDQWSEFNGNGASYIVLELDKNNFENVNQAARELGYRPLPIAENIYGPLKDYMIDKQGVYRVLIDDEESMSFTGVVLSETDHSVAVYFAVN